MSGAGWRGTHDGGGFCMSMFIIDIVRCNENANFGDARPLIDVVYDDVLLALAPPANER
jgi:hypothetical protein